MTWCIHFPGNQPQATTEYFKKESRWAPWSQAVLTQGFPTSSCKCSVQAMGGWRLPVPASLPCLLLSCFQGPSVQAACTVPLLRATSAWPACPRVFHFTFHWRAFLRLTGSETYLTVHHEFMP